jgi:hypothetical protein
MKTSLYIRQTLAVAPSLARRPAWRAGKQIKQVILAFFGLMVLSSPQAATAQQAGDFGYTTDGAAITITNYTGTNLEVVIPGAIQNLPVTDIAPYAFAG